MTFEKFSKYALLVLTSLSLIATALVSKELLFPFITTKAFFFRIVLELGLPFYAFLLVKNPALRPNLKHPLNFLVIGFLFINLLSGLFGVDPTKSLWGNFERMGGVYYLAHLVLLYFYVLMIGQMGGRYIQMFCKALLAVSALITLNGISGMLGGPTLTLDPSLPVRASSTLGNPIFFASFLIFPLFLSLFFLLQSRKLFGKWMYGILALLQFVGIFQSGTRGALVGLVLGVFLAGVVYVFLARNKKIRLYGLAVILVFVIVSGSLFVYYDKLFQNTSLRRMFNLRDSNTSARLIQWQVALRGAQDYLFLGTGPENYYVIGNKYYDNELYNYDRSWFDKPHNYLLEILITNGILGVVAYLGMLLSAIWVLWQAFKRQILTHLEACLFLAAILTYQIQNLFVFDTIPASLMFYAFLGFVGFLFVEVKANQGKNSRPIIGRTASEGLALTVAGLSLVMAIYLVIVTNILPMKASRSVNYGFAYISVDPYKAAEFFETATTLPFNFDLAETGSKFGDFANSLVRSSLAASDRPFVEKQLNQSLAYELKALEQTPQDPIVLQKLANIYLYISVFNKSPIPVEAIEAIKRAIELAPKRVEARLAFAQLRLYQGFPKEAAEIAETAARLDYNNKDVKWQLAMVYYDAERTVEAVKLAEELLLGGYKPLSKTDLFWLIDHYVTLGQKDKAVEMAEKNVDFAQGSPTSVAKLYLVYMRFDLAEKAKALLAGYKSFQPENYPEVERLIQPK